jgi:hypothetical protein
MTYANEIKILLKKEKIYNNLNKPKKIKNKIKDKINTNIDHDYFYLLQNYSGINYNDNDKLYFQLNNFEPIIPKNTYHEIINQDTYDYKPSYENLTHINYNKIHRYDRVYRLKVTLSNLCGLTGTPPKWLMNYINTELKIKILNKPNKAYMIIYTYLRKKKWGKFYYCIADIIYQITKIRWKINYEIYEKIINSFLVLHNTFKYYSNRLKRIRFPKMQFVCLILLELENIKQPYYIPLAKTKRRLANLKNLFDNLQEYKKRI